MDKNIKDELNSKAVRVNDNYIDSVEIKDLGGLNAFMSALIPMNDDTNIDMKSDSGRIMSALREVNNTMMGNNKSSTIDENNETMNSEIDSAEITKIGDYVKFYHILNKAKVEGVMHSVDDDGVISIHENGVDKNVSNNGMKLSLILMSLAFNHKVSLDNNLISISYESIVDYLSHGRAQRVRESVVDAYLEEAFMSRISVREKLADGGEDVWMLPAYLTTGSSTRNNVRTIVLYLNPLLITLMRLDDSNMTYSLIPVKHLHRTRTIAGTQLFFKLFQFKHSGKVYLSHSDLLHLFQTANSEDLSGLRYNDFKKKYINKAVNDCQQWFPNLKFEEKGNRQRGMSPVSYEFSFTPLRDEHRARAESEHERLEAELNREALKQISGGLKNND